MEPIFEISKEVSEVTAERVSNMTPEERKQRLVELSEYVNEYYQILGTCPHQVKRGLDSDSAICEICGRRTGWWCPKSPDNMCYYFSENINGIYIHKVRLADGTLVDVPEGHNPDNESDDWCIFCGLPNERI
jgi:hypothetical protein